MNIWKSLNPLINPKKQNKKSSISKLNIDGNIIIDQEAISNAMNTFFCNVGANLQGNIPWHDPNEFKSSLPPNNLASFYLAPVEYLDVFNIIKKLNPKKSPGPDNIGAKILLCCPELFSTNLTMIYNHYIELGEYPSALKIAKVIPIFKKGSHSIPGNYRPISLLSIFDKIFERLICKNLVAFLDKYKLLYKFQYGFRKLFGTSLCLIEYTDTIRRLVDKGNYVFSLFIDFSKAFDTVDHEILLYKLNHYGIRGHANNFFRSYLSQRQQYTVIGNSTSDLQNISCGVPQGSVLGPILFLIYINDLYRCVDDCLVRLFADDTSLIVYDKNIRHLVNSSKDKIKLLSNWCICNKLTINYDKTCFILFHTKNKSIPADLDQIQINTNIIKRVSSTKYLGVILDECFTWKDHVNYVCKSLLKYFGIFNRVKNFVSNKISRLLYFAFIYSRIKYGIQIYGTCASSLLNKLQIIQNKLMKLLLKLDRLTSTNDVHSRLDILKVKHIHELHVIDFVNNCELKRNPSYFDEYFKGPNSHYNLRDRGIHIPGFNKVFSELSVKVIGARLWNDLPDHIKQHRYKLNFKKHIKLHYMSMYH